MKKSLKKIFLMLVVLLVALGGCGADDEVNEVDTNINTNTENTETLNKTAFTFLDLEIAGEKICVPFSKVQLAAFGELKNSYTELEHGESDQPEETYIYRKYYEFDGLNYNCIIDKNGNDCEGPSITCTKSGLLSSRGIDIGSSLTDILDVYPYEPCTIDSSGEQVIYGEFGHMGLGGAILYDGEIPQTVSLVDELSKIDFTLDENQKIVKIYYQAPYPSEAFE